MEDPELFPSVFGGFSFDTPGNFARLNRLQRAQTFRTPVISKQIVA